MRRTFEFPNCGSKQLGRPLLASDWYHLVGRLIDIIPTDEVREMGETVRKVNTGVKRHGIKTTVFSRIFSYTEEGDDHLELPVPSQRVDRAEAWEAWAEHGADRKEVISVMNGLSESILAKCIGTREEEQDSDSSEVEEQKKPTGDSDDTSQLKDNVFRIKGNKRMSQWRTCTSESQGGMASGHEGPL